MSRHPNPRAFPPRQPLLWAALAFAAGIAAGSFAWRPPTWWAVAIAVFFVSACVLQRQRASSRIAAGIAVATLFFLGAWNLQVQPRTSPQAAGIFGFADGDEVTVTAHVIREGDIKDAGPDEQVQRIDVETETVASAGHTTAVSAGLRLGIYSRHRDSSAGSTMPLFRYGQRLEFPAKLRPPRNFKNPGSFDYEAYLAQNGISVLGSTKAEEIEPLLGFAGSRAESWRSRVHRSVIQKIHALWPAPQAALIDAMVIGEHAFIDRDTRADFQRSGTYHILVVSGMNVSILAAVIFWVLRRLRASEVLAAVLTVALSVAYALLTNVGSPVWRAVLMMTIYLGARLLYRERSRLNALGAAALGIMVFDPPTLLGASFQLTFLSVLIIAAVCVPFLERIALPYARGLRYLDSTSYDIALPSRVAQFRLDLRMIAGRLGRFVGQKLPLPVMARGLRTSLAAAQIVFVSAVMQVGFALPMAYYFHRATVIGVPANALAVPLTGVLMATAVPALVVAYVALPLAKIPAFITSLALNGITGSLHTLGRLRAADLRVPTPSLLAMLVAVAGLALAMLLARRRPLLAWTGVVILALTGCWISLVPRPPVLRPGVLEVTAIDVGQGDSTLLVSPEGKTLLVDAGGPVGGQHTELDFGEVVVSPYLWSRGISRLDAVAVTHGHSDHITGMAAVLRNFQPRELWVGVLPPTAAVRQLLRQATAQGITIKEHYQDDAFNFGGAGVRVLAPPRDWQAADQPRNNDSMVLHFTYRKTAALLEADAEKAVEQRMTPFTPRADLLRLAHNGSLTSSLPQFLDAVHPRMAVISVGARNTFGHPRLEVLERLEARGVATYRTDLDGAVTFYLDGTAVVPSLTSLP